MTHIPLLVIVGPTAAGKTAASLELAKALAGEIISADSRYLYRGMDIGTAKPSLAERAAIPHHLIDVTDPDQPWSLAQFKRAATVAIADIAERGNLPMLVGGTGQYIRAVLEGWTIPPRTSNSRLREELEGFAAESGAAALHARLAEVDAQAAAAIDYRNVRRVVRALEVTLQSGIPFSEQRRSEPPPYDVFQLGLNMPRADLYARIDQRVDEMLATGLLEEMESLVARGLDWSLPAMSALGYKQLGNYIRGECTLDEAAHQIKRETRRFVRRQANWFQVDDLAIHWFNPLDTSTEVIIATVQKWLAARGVLNP